MEKANKKVDMNLLIIIIEKRKIKKYIKVI